MFALMFNQALREKGLTPDEDGNYTLGRDELYNLARDVHLTARAEVPDISGPNSHAPRTYQEPKNSVIFISNSTSRSSSKGFHWFELGSEYDLSVRELLYRMMNPAPGTDDMGYRERRKLGTNEWEEGWDDWRCHPLHDEVCIQVRFLQDFEIEKRTKEAAEAE